MLEVSVFSLCRVLSWPVTSWDVLAVSNDSCSLFDASFCFLSLAVSQAHKEEVSQNNQEVKIFLSSWDELRQNTTLNTYT